MTSLLLGVFIVAIVPFSIIMALPRGLFPYLIGWLSIAALNWTLWPSGGRSHGSPGDFMGFIFMQASLAALVMSLLIKFVLFLVLDRGKPKSSPPAAAMLGILSGISLVLIAAIIFQHIRPSWVAHGLAVILVIAWGVLPRFVPWSRVNGDWRWFTCGIYGSVAILTLVATIWGGISFSRLLQGAEAIAKEAPYCLQVAKSGQGFAPVTSLLDLSPLTMRAQCGGGICYKYHATLEVKNKVVAHWSYRAIDFKATPIPAPIYCVSRLDFLKKFPWITFSAEEFVNISIDNNTFYIPRAYAPDAGNLDLRFSKWNTQYPYLVFYAAAPDFTPVSSGEKRLEDRIEIFTGPPDLLESAVDKRSGWSDSGVEVGLLKQETTGAIRYWERDEEGQLQTVITCYSRANCQHMFTHGGWIFNFHHMQKDVQDWQKIQNKIVDLMQSFFGIERQ